MLTWIIWSTCSLAFRRINLQYTKGSTRFRIEVEFDDDPSDLDSIILDFCAYIKESLVLDKLRRSSPRIFREILATRDGLTWVRDFREIEINKIKLKLTLVDGEGEGPENSEGGNSTRLDDSDDDSVEYFDRGRSDMRAQVGEGDAL